MPKYYGVSLANWFITCFKILLNCFEQYHYLEYTASTVHRYVTGENLERIFYQAPNS